VENLTGFGGSEAKRVLRQEVRAEPRSLGQRHHLLLALPQTLSTSGHRRDRHE